MCVLLCACVCVNPWLAVQDVKCVVNVDFPLTVKSYVHRVGRTARGGKSGMALSLCAPSEEKLLEQVMAFQMSSLFCFVLCSVFCFSFQINTQTQHTQTDKSKRASRRIPSRS